jgi:hypothetical protein
MTKMYYISKKAMSCLRFFSCEGNMCNKGVDCEFSHIITPPFKDGKYPPSYINPEELWLEEQQKNIEISNNIENNIKKMYQIISICSIWNNDNIEIIDDYDCYELDNIVLSCINYLEL